MGYRDEGQGWIGDTEMKDKDRYGIQRVSTKQLYLLILFMDLVLILDDLTEFKVPSTCL